MHSFKLISFATCFPIQLRACQRATPVDLVRNIGQALVENRPSPQPIKDRPFLLCALTPASRPHRARHHVAATAPRRFFCSHSRSGLSGGCGSSKSEQVDRPITFGRVRRTPVGAAFAELVRRNVDLIYSAARCAWFATRTWPKMCAASSLSPKTCAVVLSTTSNCYRHDAKNQSIGFHPRISICALKASRVGKSYCQRQCCLSRRSDCSSRLATWKRSSMCLMR